MRLWLRLLNRPLLRWTSTASCSMRISIPERRARPPVESRRRRKRRCRRTRRQRPNSSCDTSTVGEVPEVTRPYHGKKHEEKQIEF
jgi:hypothetical protein